MRIVLYALPQEERARVIMPSGAKPLGCEVRGREVMVRAMINPDSESAMREFMQVASAGDFLQAYADKYLGTVHTPLAPEIPLHIFDLGELPE